MFPNSFLMFKNEKETQEHVRQWYAEKPADPVRLIQEDPK